jgi:chitinase
VAGTTSVLEGNSGTTALRLPVTLSHPSAQTVTAHWSTVFAPNASGSRADPSTDYTTVSGTVTFAPGQTAKAVTINVKGDSTVEPNEYILVSFSKPTYATIGGVYGLAFGTITNDD